MSRAQWCAFVPVDTRTGNLATVRRDGRSHVAPIWFLLDGDDLIFTTGATTGGRSAVCPDSSGVRRFWP